jgi:hypothetical protein
MALGSACQGTPQGHKALYLTPPTYACKDAYR